ncbi:MAG: hypothetical protein O3B21_03065 [Proteobacteria bacterium]|nr:hypothetical protein [Pseudomonadota bacterium]MDA1357299.1 hypothetical protein [Pseudomonadota bacterium]
MTTNLKFGIQTNGIKHAHSDAMPDIDRRFAMVRDAGVFDYVDKTPDPDQIDEFLGARDKYGLPVRAGGWFYTLGADEALLEKNLELGARLGSVVHNTQIMLRHADGHIVTDEEVMTVYMRASEFGERHGCLPCFEVHVNMWSEDFPRVSRVGRMIESRGAEFNMTLDHSHVIFKMNNPDEQRIFDTDKKIASGELILDPFQPGNVIEEWVSAGWVRHCHARAAVPNNPRNTPAHHPDGSVGRGIQYPFIEPRPNEYHAPWSAEALEPWKEGMRILLRHRANDASAKLGQISTEFIPNTDYGEGCGYSLFDQAVSCVTWMRGAWDAARAETA